MKAAVAICCVLAISAGIGESLKVVRNGYEELVVAIDDNAEEDPRIVDRLKVLLTQASASLFRATGYRLFFRDITILIPDSWEKTHSDKTIKGFKSTLASIRIQDPSPEYGDEPYTIQEGECGEQGEFIHLTPAFVLNGSRKLADRKVVQEWAQYRFGVFSEAPEPGVYPKFYTVDGKTPLPTGCTSHTHGELVERPGCVLDPVRRVPNDVCDFRYNVTSDFTASIMFRHDLESAFSFCGIDSSRPHNKLAPTRQNELCRKQSTWEVIANHEDIKNNRPIFSSISTVPRFTIAKEGDPMVYVFVLDISGSMDFQNRIGHLHSSTIRVIDTMIEEGSYLSVITFDSVAEVVLPLTKVTSTNKDYIKSKVPNKTRGATSIGAGLQAALNILGSNAEGTLIFLMSDGEENTPPTIDSIKPKIIESKVIINCISFGQDATQSMNDIMRATGGEPFYVPDGEDASENLAKTYYQSIVHYQTSYSLRPVKMSSEPVPLKPNEQVKKKTVLDDTVGNKTRFSMFSKAASQIDFKLISPTNQVFTSSSSNFKRGPDSQEYYFPHATPGEWKSEVTYKGSGVPPVTTMEVTSAPVSKKQAPARIDGGITNRQFDFTASKLPMAKITTRVFKKSSPILDAYAEASITRPSGEQTKLVLLDNGQEPDVKKDDGIYSAYFTQFNGNGFYSIDFLVRNNGTATIMGKKPTYGNDDNGLVRIPVENFERVTSGGSFTVANYKENVKVSYPPAKVTDFQVKITTISEGLYLAQFEWTVPVDNFPDNPGCTIDVRAAYSLEPLLNRFNESFQFTDEHLVRGSFSCLATSQKQTAVVYLPKQFTSVASRGDIAFFALKAKNRNHVTSDTSNVVYSAFSPEK